MIASSTYNPSPTVPLATPTQPMSLHEARGVLWLNNYPRPLGELLDAGYLTTHRLTWAAQKARDPQLREAAGVLLDSLAQSPIAPAPPSAAASRPETAPAIGAGITLEQARAVLWPFRPLKGQRMGELVDTRQLNLKDLAYAIENAWEARVRQAAVALMTVRLDQVLKEPAPPAGPLKVVSHGRSYCEAQQFRWTLLEGILAGALFALAVTWVVSTLRSSGPPAAPNVEKLMTPGGIIAVLILIGLMVAAMWLTSRLIDLVFNRLERQIAIYRKGEAGEEQALELLRQNLDGRWTLFRNVILPGRSRADIDGVLVGPPGIWALEVKALTGQYRNIGEHWEYRAGKRWKLARKSPSRQAINNAARLSGFLKADGITQWVTPAVIWVNQESPLSVENPLAAVWTTESLPEELGNLWQSRDSGEPDRARTIEKLSLLCRNRDEG